MIPTTHAPNGPADALDRARPTSLASCWPPDALCARASVRVAWNSAELFVRADLEDEEVTTAATDDSQLLWKLGDVFEIFLEADGAGFYTEMHVAPENHRLHLRLRPEDREAMRGEPLSPADLMVRPPGFESRFRTTPSGWSVEARIPAALVDPKGVISARSRWNASFCRYDAWTDGRPPVLSSTTPHKELDFHRRHEWRQLCF